MATKKTTTRKPAKKAATRRAPERSVPTLILDPVRLVGMTAGDVANVLGNIDARTPLRIAGLDEAKLPNRSPAPTPVSKDPNINDLLDLSGVLNDELHHVISLHEERIEPVLAQRKLDEAKGEAGDVAEASSKSSIANRIQYQSSQLQLAIQRLRRLNDRVEL